MAADKPRTAGARVVTPESPLTEFLKHSKLWLPVAVAVVIAALWVMVRHFQEGKSLEAVQASWNQLMRVTEPDPATGVLRGDADALARVAEDQGGGPSGPWARLLEVTQRLDEWDHEGARSALQRLRSEHPDHFLVAQPVVQGAGSTLTIADNLGGFIDRQQTWYTSHPELFRLPEPSPNSPQARLVTSQGDIVVTLYNDRVPALSDSFLRLAQEGFYNGTRIHLVQKGVRIEGGDPHTRDEGRAVEEWGSGGRNQGAPDETSPLKHFAGALAMAPLVGGEQSTSRFMITVADANQLNGQGQVFGVVTEGMDVVRAIADAPTEPGALRPAEAVVVEQIQVF